jgi:primosomal protein N' (replication factor Y)
LKYPPFCDIIVVSFNSTSEEEIQKISKGVYEYLRNNLKEDEFKVFKPMPSPIDKIQNRLRYRIIIKGRMSEEANRILNNMLKKVYQKNLKDTRIMVDVNPNNMM